MKKLIFSTFIILCLISEVSSAPVFKLRVKINGAKDTFLMLAHYYGEKQYIDDTLQLDKKGWYTMQCDSILASGLYIIAGDNKNRYFEFLLDGESKIEFETSALEPIKDMKVKDSPDNEVFFGYIRYLSGQQKAMEAFQEELKTVKENKQEEARIKGNMESVNIEVIQTIEEYIKNYKGKFISDFIRASQEIQIPAAPLLENGHPDSSFAYIYYKKHYFDNLNLGDARLLRTPMYHPRLNQYFSKMIIQHPDSIIAETKRMLSVVEKNPETFRYLIWYLLNFTERSQIMGMDAAFVYISENFYENGRMDFWVNKTVKENIVKKSNKLKPNLIGAIAPELIMLDTLMVPVSLHNVKSKYTILFFWDPECGHCRKEVPLLVKFYQENKDKFGLEIFAVCSDTNMREMKTYIIKNKMNWINVNGPRTYMPNYRELYDVYSTPVLYLLDEKKQIIAKRLLTEQLLGFITRREENQQEGPIGISTH
ncbi:MAG: thioredoxin-like domain-containing protein [Bacteroidales bacterium]|nr:thioredoxin-like domain-containing protein [Bacteroidales bacterium]